jgi:hypothetical protein
MDMPARPFGEPVADQWGLVRGVVVHDEMDIAASMYCGWSKEFLEAGKRRLVAWTDLAESNRAPPFADLPHLRGALREAIMNYRTS